jgi:hypothetical protein
MRRCDCCSHLWENGRPRDRGPAVARWICSNGNPVWLCQSCLDIWFDNADNDPDLEPASWSWIPSSQPAGVPAYA